MHYCRCVYLECASISIKIVISLGRASLPAEVGEAVKQAARAREVTPARITDRKAWRSRNDSHRAGRQEILAKP